MLQDRAGETEITAHVIKDTEKAIDKFVFFFFLETFKSQGETI